MIEHSGEWWNPVCDGCGAMMFESRTEAGAEESMMAEGWTRMSGRDICPICARKLEQKDQQDNGWTNVCVSCRLMLNQAGYSVEQQGPERVVKCAHCGKRGCCCACSVRKG